MTDRAFRANAPRVVDETVDGETLIIDMATGSYFSCAGASSVAWTALTQAAPVNDVAHALAASYGVAVIEVATDLERFVDALVAEELLVAGQPMTGDEGERNPVEVAGTDAYQPPRLEKYTDLADLILLDPVHDVSAAGWPSGNE